MSDIPSEIFPEILHRLPAESLLRFRVVYKAWRSIIDDPSFVKSHTNNQHSSATIVMSRGKRLFSLSLDTLKHADGSQKIEATPVKPLIRRGVPQLSELPVASCNGLILISDFSFKKAWVLWNPLTRDFHEFPEPNIDMGSPGKFFLLGIGLGYDFDSDDYKVVRIDVACDSGENVNRTLVYSLKLDSWKMIKNCPWDFVPCTSGVFLNGALHFLSSDMIIKLDLGTEEFNQLPLPPPPVIIKPGKSNLDVLVDSSS